MYKNSEKTIFFFDLKQIQCFYFLKKKLFFKIIFAINRYKKHQYKELDYR